MKIEDFNFKKFDVSRKIVIYGTEEYGIMVTEGLRQQSIPFWCYADEKGCMLPDIPILGLKELSELYQEEKIIVLLALPFSIFEEQRRLIEAYNINVAYACWSLLDAIDLYKSNFNEHMKNIFINRFTDIILQEQLINPKGLYLRSLDAVVSERCSLKCKDCSNLMQYYKNPQNLSVDELKDSIGKLLDNVDRIGELRILGGEPFMNNEFVKLVDAYAHESKILQIAVFTNATIFPKKEILMHLITHKMNVRLSDYGELSGKIDTWIRWCQDNEVNYSISRMDRWQDCGKPEKRSYTELKLREVYSTCECRNLPTILKGRLYNCAYAANAANLGAVEQSEAEKDSIDLTRQLPAKSEMDAFLYERPYLEACKYCSGRNYKKASIEPYIQTKSVIEYKQNCQTPLPIVVEKCVQELISIIIPVYNVEDYAERCLSSAVNQTYKNIEIIVVDDGSTDKSTDICQRFANEDKQIQFIRTGHRGVVEARFTGLEQATGTHTIFLDADDWIEQNYIEQLVSYVEDNDIVMSGHVREWAEYKKIAESLMDRGQGQIEYVEVPLQQGIYSNEKMNIIWDNMFEPSPKRFSCALWAKVFKTSLLKQVFQQIDYQEWKQVWYMEDTVAVHIYLSYSALVRIIGTTGYHNCIRKNEGKNERYNFDRRLSNCERYYICQKKIFEGKSNAKRMLANLQIDFAEQVRKIISPLYINNSEIKGNMAYYPYYGRLEGKKVILYGAGNIGKEYRRHILTDKECELILWVDRDAQKYREEQYAVSDVNDILNTEYDYVIIAVAIEEVSKAIRNNLIMLGVPHEKILWNKTTWSM